MASKDYVIVRFPKPSIFDKERYYDHGLPINFRRSRGIYPREGYEPGVTDPLLEPKNKRIPPPTR
jgi:hypothetical protein